MAVKKRVLGNKLWLTYMHPLLNLGGLLMSNAEVNALTRESIYQALQLLLQEKEFDAISITDITTKAGVSRMAYYRNYQRKEDILIGHLDELFDNYYQELSSFKHTTIYTFALHFFDYFETNHHLIELLIQTDLTNELLGKFRQYLEKITAGLLNSTTSDPSSLESYQIHFLVGGLWNLLLNWIIDQRPHTSAYMANLIDNLGLSMLGQNPR